MSAVAQGSAATRCVEDDILVPLLARLTTIKAFLDGAAAAPPPAATTSNQDPPQPPPAEHAAAEAEAASVRDYSRELLDKIQREMASLRRLFRRIDSLEKGMRHRFDPVEQHIDDALQELHVDGALKKELHRIGRVRSELSAADAEIEAIKAKIREAYFLPDDGDEGQDNTAPAPSPPMAKVVTKKMAEVQRGPQMQHLRRVVGGFEARMRGCVLCLAAFPEGAVIKKRLLIHWWIGEGFVRSAQEGKKRFDELVGKGFIIPIPSAPCGTVHRCTVRPWMRDLLVDVARSNAFLDQDCSDFTLAHRVLLTRGKVLSRFSADARAIYNIDQKYVELDEGWFAGKKELCTLQLGQWREFGPREQIANPMDSHIEVSGVERFADIESCKSLRYISFRGISRIESLPNSIGSLRELIVLDLRACHNLEDLGQGISKLDRLEYLDLSECHLLGGMPKGIGRLTRLEVLKGFVVANTNSKDPCHLNELTKLEKLRKLGIVIGKMAVPTDDEFMKLGEFKKLKSLTIRWGLLTSEQWRSQDRAGPGPNMINGVKQCQTVPNSATVIKELRRHDPGGPGPVSAPASEKNQNEEGVASHPVAMMDFALPLDLEKLDLHCFPLTEFPQWVPKGVKKLCIRGGKLKTLGNDEDWEVKVLRLRFLSDLKYSNDRLAQCFKTLEHTDIKACPNFKSE